MLFLPPFLSFRMNWKIRQLGYAGRWMMNQNDKLGFLKKVEKLIWGNLLAIPTLADAFPVSSFGLTHFLELSPIPWNIGMWHIKLKLSARRTRWHTSIELGCCHSNIGRCFCSFFFWISAFLGRVTHSFKYRHVAHQIESLGTPNQLTYNL